MFAEYLSKTNLSEVLMKANEYHPFPRASERGPWERLPVKLKEDMLKKGEKYTNFVWPSTPAVRFMDFQRNGDRMGYEAIYFSKRTALISLVIAECIEGRGRYLDDIINGIWCICEESFWGITASIYMYKNPKTMLPDVAEPIVDLFAAETAGLLSWVFYLLRDQLDEVSPLICDRIKLETKFRVLDPYLERNDFWWMGYLEDNGDHVINNWNPWIHSNCLSAFLFLEEDEPRRNTGITKIMDSLDRFVAVYHSDGGCDEGPQYWNKAGASLFDCLEQLYIASDGKINFYDEFLVKEIGRYIYKVHIYGDYFINFADGDARVNIDGNLVYRYGKRIGDSRLMTLGANAFRSNPYDNSENIALLREIPKLFSYSEVMEAVENPPYIRDVWLDGIQVMAAREQEGSCAGLYLAAKGGHNNESHNHNDVGQFIAYYDGKPAVIDIGIGTYTAKTFSPRRYEIWTMQSAYHNLPAVNGTEQQAGSRFKASGVTYKATDELSELSMDIGTAYPEEAGIVYWRRRFALYRRPEPVIEITDSFQLKEASENITLSLMTPFQPEIDPEGIIRLGNGTDKLQIGFDGCSLTGSSEYIPIDDKRLVRIWEGRLYRILLRAKTPMARGEWTLKIT